MHDLLVGTSKALYLIHNGEPREILNEGMIYYGITWDEENLYIAERKREAISIINKDGYIQYFKPEGGEFKALHAMHYYNGILYIIETGRNIICSVDLKNKTFKRHYHRGESDNKYHINTMYIDDNFIYVVEHNKIEKTGIPSKVVFYTHDFNLVGWMDNMGTASHNVWIEGDFIYVCSSMDEGIIKRHLKSKKQEFIDTTKYCTGLTRGIAHVDGYRYIGISKFGNREERHLGGDSIVLILDEDWNYIDKINLGDAGQLLEIRAIDGIDKCHNGIPFPKGLKETLLNI